MYPIKFTPQSKKDVPLLKKEFPKLVAKLLELIMETSETPFSGTGNPKQLKGDYKGCWSRRINQKHRLIYKIIEEQIIIISCYGHYDDK